LSPFGRFELPSQNPRISHESKLVTEPAEPRRLPAPWRVVEHSESFVVEDANGRPLAYVYFEDEPVRRGLMNRLFKLLPAEAW
jgi:hypothetical protein